MDDGWGWKRAFVADMASAAIDNFYKAYPDLETNRAFILRVLNLEEERFNQTIQIGMPMLEEGLIPLHLGLRQIFQVERPMTEMTKAGMLRQIDELAEEAGGFVRPQSVLQDVLREAATDMENANELPVESRLTRMLTGREVFVLHDTFRFSTRTD